VSRGQRRRERLAGQIDGDLDIASSLASGHRMSGITIQEIVTGARVAGRE